MGTKWNMQWPNHSLQWRHNERNNVSNCRGLDCYLNRFFRRRSKKTSKPRVTSLCGVNPSLTGGFPSKRASNAENVSIWWHHHDWKLISGISKLEKNGGQFTCDLFRRIFFREGNLWIFIHISIKLVLIWPITNQSALVQLMIGYPKQWWDS